MAIKPDDYLLVGRNNTSYQVKFSDSGISQNDDYVMKTGDTMTGDLTLKTSDSEKFMRLKSGRYMNSPTESFGLILDLTDANTYHHKFKILTRTDREALILYDDGTPRFKVNGALTVKGYGDQASDIFNVFDKDDNKLFNISKSGNIYSKSIRFNKDDGEYLKFYSSAGGTEICRFYRFNSSETRWEVKTGNTFKYVANSQQAFKITAPSDSSSNPTVKLHFLDDPSADGDAVNLKYLNDKTALYLPLAGGRLTGNVYGSMQFKSTRNAGNCFEVKPDDVTVRCALTHEGRIDITMATRTNAAIRTIGSINVKANNQSIGGNNSFIAHQDYVRNYTSISHNKDCATKEYVDNKVASGTGPTLEYTITKSGSTYYIS